MPSKSTHCSGGRRTYRDLLDKRFNISKVIRNERSFDRNDIANKWCDFSSDNITTLFEQRIRDANETLRLQDS